MDAEAGEELLEHALVPFDVCGHPHHDDRYLGLNDLVAAHDLEVDVGHGTTDGMTLKLTGQDKVGRTLNL
jgi:hypothetical protein